MYFFNIYQNSLYTESVSFSPNDITLWEKSYECFVKFVQFYLFFVNKKNLNFYA